jgi:hypothetical protein
MTPSPSHHQPYTLRQIAPKPPEDQPTVSAAGSCAESLRMSSTDEAGEPCRPPRPHTAISPPISLPIQPREGQSRYWMAPSTIAPQPVSSNLYRPWKMVLGQAVLILKLKRRISKLEKKVTKVRYTVSTIMIHLLVNVFLEAESGAAPM